MKWQKNVCLIDANVILRYILIEVKMRIKLTISYDGTDFVGWQRQNLPRANNRSVQGELEGQLRLLLHQPVSLQGAGRTDAGVHAMAQAASFEAELGLPPERLAYALNNRLPADVRVLAAEPVAEDFHARFSAHSKEYRYFLVLGQAAGAFDNRYAWFCSYALPQLAQMSQAAALLVGEHDFRRFCGRSAVVNSYVRRLYRAEFGLCTPQAAPAQLRALAEAGVLYCFQVAGNGFIYKMVRLLTGALVKLGRGQLTLPQLAAALAAGGPLPAEDEPWPQPLAPAAPAKGLYLWRIDY